VTETLPLELLAPLGCGPQTGAGKVMNSLAVKAGSSIASFGTGSVGLAAVMVARSVGAVSSPGIPGEISVKTRPGVRLICCSDELQVHRPSR
jgi:Zn-dependent alcohol dehydrogenase